MMREKKHSRSIRERLGRLHGPEVLPLLGKLWPWAGAGKPTAAAEPEAPLWDACFELGKGRPRALSGAEEVAAFSRDGDLEHLRDERPRVVFRDRNARFADVVFAADGPNFQLVCGGRQLLQAQAQLAVVDVTSPEALRVTLTHDGQGRTAPSRRPEPLNALPEAVPIDELPEALPLDELPEALPA
jgi:hypothetical protein